MCRFSNTEYIPLGPLKCGPSEQVVFIYRWSLNRGWLYVYGKYLIVERNGWKFGTRGPRNCMCRVLFRSDSEFSLGSFGSLCKLSDVELFKRLPPPQFSFNFNQTLWKVWYSEGNTGYYFLDNLPNLIYCRLKFLLTQDHIVLEFKNATPPIYVSSGLSQTFWGHSGRFKNVVALWNFNMGVNGKMVKCAVTC